MKISNDKLTLLSVSSLNLDELLLDISPSIISFAIIIIFFLIFIFPSDAFDFFQYLISTQQLFSFFSIFIFV